MLSDTWGRDRPQLILIETFNLVRLLRRTVWVHEGPAKYLLHQAVGTVPFRRIFGFRGHQFENVHHSVQRNDVYCYIAVDSEIAKLATVRSVERTSRNCREHECFFVPLTELLVLLTHCCKQFFFTDTEFSSQSKTQHDNEHSTLRSPNRKRIPPRACRRVGELHV